ncbi:MAG: hypothetical protein WC214_05280 [Candidatus Omnitrophota bacterium]
MFHGKPFDLDTGLYYSGSGVYYSPEVAVDVNTPAVYYSPEDYGEGASIHEPKNYQEYAALYGQYNANIWFIRNQGIERRNVTDTFICEKICDDINELSIGIREYQYETTWGSFVGKMGAHDYGIRLPGGYHITVDEGHEGVYLHYDVKDPLRVSEVIGHFIEYLRLETGWNMEIYQNKNPDIGSKSTRGK